MDANSSTGNNGNHRNHEGQLLIVDDQPATLRILKRHLLVNNYDVSLAENGTMALEMAYQSEFDTVILDVMMPGINGFDVCRQLRSKFSLFELPIMFLTAKSELSDLTRGFEVDGNDFLTKPFEVTELIARVRTLVKLKKLTRTNKVLQEAIDLKNQILQISAHDLKNPLTSINTLSAMLLEEKNYTPNQQNIIQVIQKASSNVIKIVEDLLLMSRLESGKLILNREDMDFNSVVENVISSNQHNANQKEQSIEFEKSKETIIFSADSLRMHEIIDNLISNAIKYSPYQEKIIIKTSKKVRSENEKFILLEVRDNGPGISEEDKKKMFGKFQKLSAMPTGGENSTGLGLSITKELVEIHGGKIWAEKHQAKGTSFYVEFPLPMANVI